MIEGRLPDKMDFFTPDVSSPSEAAAGSPT